VAFQAGFNKGVVWVSSLSQAPAGLNVLDHAWKEIADWLEVTHSGTGGFQASLPGIIRGDGNVKANSDDAQVIAQSSIAIVAGGQGVLAFFHYATVLASFKVPAQVTDVEYKTVVNGVCNYSFNIKLNILAGVYTGGAGSFRVANLI
jgi:hypothetical protein